MNKGNDIRSVVQSHKKQEAVGSIPTQSVTFAVIENNSWNLMITYLPIFSVSISVNASVKLSGKLFFRNLKERKIDLKYIMQQQEESLDVEYNWDFKHISF